LPQQWQQSIAVPVYRKGDNTDCSNYTAISLLTATYTIWSNILLSRLTAYAEESIGDHQCGFRSVRSTADDILCICQILEKKWEYNEAVHQLFIDFKKAYDSGRREVLCDVLVQFGIPVKLARLIKLCPNEMYSRVWVGKHLSDIFSVKNGLKEGDALAQLLFNLD